jgi:predicted TIM-barrel fold metal-dependent hydrolase
VPLMGTAELSNAVLADCVSKTTLRVALHEVMQEFHPEEVYYWPSFEIVRWLGGHTTLPAFGTDDGMSRHVSNWLVEVIVNRFSRHLFGAPASPGASAPMAAQPAAGLSRWSQR